MNEKLKQKGINEKLWEHCFISSDGDIFPPVSIPTPIYEECGVIVSYEYKIIKDGKTVYNESLLIIPEHDKISTCLERLDLQEESTLDIDYRLTLMELCI